MKSIRVVIMICLATLVLSGCTACVSNKKKIPGPDTRYGGVIPIFRRHLKEYHGRHSESVVSDFSLSGVKIAVSRKNTRSVVSDHYTREEAQSIENNLNTIKENIKLPKIDQNTSRENVQLTVNDKTSAKHRDSSVNNPRTNGKNVTWIVTKVSMMGGAPFTKRSRSELADTDTKHKRTSVESPPFPAPPSVPRTTFPWNDINITTNLASGDSYSNSRRRKTEEVTRGTTLVSSRALPVPPHNTTRRWSDRDGPVVTRVARSGTSEDKEEEERTENKVASAGYVPTLPCPPHALGNTYMDTSQAGWFWSWEAIVMVSLPGAWLVLLAVMCCLTRSPMGRKLLQWLGPPPDDGDDLEQGHGILFFDGSPGMRRSLTDPEGATVEEVGEQAEGDNKRDIEEAGGVKAKYAGEEMTVKQANGLATRGEGNNNEGASNDRQLSKTPPLSLLKTSAILENLTMQRKLSLISEESSH